MATGACSPMAATSYQYARSWVGSLTQPCSHAELARKWAGFIEGRENAGKKQVPSLASHTTKAGPRRVAIHITGRGSSQYHVACVEPRGDMALPVLVK